jgi:hypothetical protein
MYIQFVSKSTASLPTQEFTLRPKLTLYWKSLTYEYNKIRNAGMT